MSVADLRKQLTRLHTLAEEAIVAGFDYAAWHDMHWAPLVSLRVDALCKAACGREGKSKADWKAEQREHARLAREFRPREDQLADRARCMAEKPTEQPRQAAPVGGDQ